MDRNAADTCFVPISRWADGQRLAHILRRSAIDLRDWPVKGVTKYGDWRWSSDLRVAECKDWTFAGIAGVPFETPTTTFLWNPPPVDPEADELTRKKGRLISESLTVQNYPWPSVLRDLQIAVSPFYVVPIRDWVPGDNLPSVVRVRTYVSDVAPSAFLLRTDPPKPTEVEGSYNTTRVSYPPCLHGEVILQPKYPEQSSFYDAMPANGGSNRMNVNFLKHYPTNHETWRNHDFDVSVVEDDGLFFRTVSHVYAPRMPETTLQ